MLSVNSNRFDNVVIAIRFDKSTKVLPIRNVSLPLSTVKSRRAILLLFRAPNLIEKWANFPLHNISGSLLSLSIAQNYVVCAIWFFVVSVFFL